MTELQESYDTAQNFFIYYLRGKYGVHKIVTATSTREVLLAILRGDIEFNELALELWFSCFAGGKENSWLPAEV